MARGNRDVRMQMGNDVLRCSPSTSDLGLYPVATLYALFGHESHYFSEGDFLTTLDFLRSTSISVKSSRAVAYPVLKIA